jgi:hypothetical protein
MRIFGFDINKVTTQVEPGYKRTTMEATKPFVPPEGSVVKLGGFMYRVRKITDKDVILRPVGNEPQDVIAPPAEPQHGADLH